MPTPPASRTGPLESGPVRQVIHIVFIIAGWCLFVWWWWLVMQRVSRAEMEFTGWFIALSLVVIVLSTSLWAFHNVRLFRRKGPRQNLRVVTADLTHDTVGRPVDMPEVAEECLTSREIVIRIEGDKKVYRSAGPGRPVLRVLEPGASGEVAS